MRAMVQVGLLFPTLAAAAVPVSAAVRLLPLPPGLPVPDRRGDRGRDLDAVIAEQHLRVDELKLKVCIYIKAIDLSAPMSDQYKQLKAECEAARAELRQAEAAVRSLLAEREGRRKGPGG